MGAEIPDFQYNYQAPSVTSNNSPKNFTTPSSIDSLTTNPYYQMELTRSQLADTTEAYFMRNFKESKFYQTLKDMNIPEKDFKFSSLTDEQQNELSWRLGLPKDILNKSDNGLSEFTALQAKYKTELAILNNAAENDFVLGKKYGIGAQNDPGARSSLTSTTNTPASGKLISDDPFNIGLKG
jgi:hypothetical protein